MKVHSVIWLWERGSERRWVVKRENSWRGYPVYPQTFVCPWCRRIWAAIDIGKNYVSEFQSTPCIDHPQACDQVIHPVAGSLIDNSTMNGYDGALLDVLPEELLKREFDLHTKAYEANSCQLKQLTYHHNPHSWRA